MLKKKAQILPQHKTTLMSAKAKQPLHMTANTAFIVKQII